MLGLPAFEFVLKSKGDRNCFDGGFIPLKNPGRNGQSCFLIATKLLRWKRLPAV